MPLREFVLLVAQSNVPVIDILSDGISIASSKFINFSALDGLNHGLRQRECASKASRWKLDDFAGSVARPINDGAAVVEDRACTCDIRVQRGTHPHCGRSAVRNFDVDRRTNEVFGLVISCGDQGDDLIVRLTVYRDVAEPAN